MCLVCSPDFLISMIRFSSSQCRLRPQHVECWIPSCRTSLLLFHLCAMIESHLHNWSKKLHHKSKWVIDRVLYFSNKIMKCALEFEDNTIQQNLFSSLLPTFWLIVQHSTMFPTKLSTVFQTSQTTECMNFALLNPSSAVLFICSDNAKKFLDIPFGCR